MLAAVESVDTIGSRPGLVGVTKAWVETRR